jgi:hypothetical protein
MRDSSFLHLSVTALANAIAQAQQRVIYCAPGVTQAIAASIANACKRIGRDRVHVVLDVDDVTARLGYGDFDAVAMLSEEGINVRVEPGLRVSVVVCDSIGFLFTTPPMLVEVQDEKHVGVNAVRMIPEQVSKILETVVPCKESSEDESSVSPIGKEVLTKERANAVMTALAENPPQKFDLARKVNVFNSFIEFADLRTTGLHITRHTVKLPRELMTALRDDATTRRILTTFRLVDEDSKVAKEAAMIDLKVRRLRETFTRSLGDDIGSVMLRTSREDFAKGVDELKTEISDFQSKVVVRLQKEIDSSLKKLVEGLLPAVRTTTPEALRGQISGPPTDAIRRRFLDAELRKVFPEAKGLVKEMKLDWISKGVTYESLSDDDFQLRVRELFPYVDWRQPFSEFEAVPASENVTQLPR